MTVEPEVNHQTFEELAQLKESLWRLSRKLIVDQGDFFPFARIIDLSGAMVAYTALSDGNSDCVESYKLLRNAMQSLGRNRKISACGLCANTDSDPHACVQGVIQMHLEHNSGVAVRVRVKYQKGRNGDVEFLPDEADPVAPEFFSMM